MDRLPDSRHSFFDNKTEVRLALSATTDTLKILTEMTEKRKDCKPTVTETTAKRKDCKPTVFIWI